MRDQLLTYFAGEKLGGIVAALLGVVALAVAIALVASRSSYRGMAVPLGLIALLELGVGIGVWARTEKQVATLLGELERAPAEMARAELVRMHTVMRNFRIIKIVELVVFVLGVVLTYAFARHPFAFAAGLGCIAQASVLLLFDLLAEHRAEPYVAALRALA